MLSPGCALSRDEKDEDDSSTIEEAMADQKLHVNGESEVVQKKISACREALLSLDTAAENVFQLFVKLGTECSMEEFSSGSGAHLYDEATELLPQIAEKVNAVAKAVQDNTNGNAGSSRSRVESSTFEPLLGTLAESLSQRVVEILKKNLSTV